jgi:hypothetical protein
MSLQGRTNTITIPAGAQRFVSADRFLLCVSATDYVIARPQTGGGGEWKLHERKTLESTDGEPIGGLSLTNPHAFPVTVELETSNGRLTDSRSTTPSGTIVAEGVEAEAAIASRPPLRVAGWDGARLRTLKTNAAGELVVGSVVAGTVEVVPHVAPAVHVDGQGNPVDATIVDVLAAPAAGLCLHVTEITINEMGGAGAATVIIYDGATEIRRYRVPANGSVQAIFPWPVPKRLTAATALRAALLAAGNVRVSASGFKAA